MSIVGYFATVYCRSTDNQCYSILREAITTTSVGLVHKAFLNTSKKIFTVLQNDSSYSKAYIFHQDCVWKITKTNPKPTRVTGQEAKQVKAFVKVTTDAVSYNELKQKLSDMETV